MAPETLNKESILGFLRENKDFFKQKFDVDSIMLFGSYARNEATKKSDVDILIDSKAKSFRKLISLQRFLEEAFKK